MKKLFTLIALGSVALVSAGQYYQPNGNGAGCCQPNNNGGGYYQNQPNNGNYYQQNQQGYNQRDNRNYQRNNQSYDQNQQYYQQQNNQPYDGDYRQVNDSNTNVKDNSETYSESQLQSSEKKYPQDFASNPQDRQLNAKIRDKLNNGWFSKGYQTLVIRTTNGVVVISGTVDKFEDIQKINDQIRDIDGVRSVNNQLTVKSR